MLGVLFGVMMLWLVKCSWKFEIFGKVFCGVWILVGKLGSVDRLLFSVVVLDVKWLLVSCMLLLELLVKWIIIWFSL